MTPMSVALDVMDRPWDWGAADCCTAACDVFQRLHGVDPMASLRGRYTTRQGASRIIASYGGFLAMAEALALGSRLSPSFGDLGDIGVIEMDTGPALAVCVGADQWAGKTLTGLVTVASVIRCWRA